MTADKHPEDEIAVDLKNRGFAALLAWLVPGLGVECFADNDSVDVHHGRLSALQSMGGQKPQG